MKSIVFLLFVLIVYQIKAFDSPPEEHLLNISFGIDYDDTEQLNEFFKNNNLPIINTSNAKYISINYSTNQCPFIYDKATHYFYSFTLRLPLIEYTRNNNYENHLETYSFFLETFVFESYLKKITIRPILGFGLSQTNLTISTINDDIIDIKNLNIKSNFPVKITKFTALFNIGGGGAFRYNLIDDAFKTKNLIIGFDIRYSLSLDILNLYNDKWHIDKTNYSIADYYAPGLSLDFYLGFEARKKEYWK